MLLAIIAYNVFFRTLANYLLWKIVLSLNSVGGKKYRDEGFLFSQVYSGQKAEAPFWDSCTGAVAVLMPFAYGRVYVDTRFKSKFAVKEACYFQFDVQGHSHKIFMVVVQGVHFPSKNGYGWGGGQGF